MDEKDIQTTVNSNEETIGDEMNNELTNGRGDE